MENNHSVFRDLEVYQAARLNNCLVINSVNVENFKQFIMTEQRIYIKFCQKLAYTSSQTIDMIRNGDCMSNAQLKDYLGISSESISRILTENLKLNRVCAKFVSQVLNQNKKDFRVEVAKDILESIRKDPELLERIIIDNEIWIYGYAPETKAQSMTREESRSKKTLQSNVKAMLTVFFD